MLSTRTAGIHRLYIPCALQVMLAVVIGLTAAVTDANGQSSDPTTGLLVEYAPPTGPGDFVVLRFPIPVGYAAGVVLMFEAPAEPPAPEDFDGGFLLPVEIDPVTGARALRGCRERRSEFFLEGTAPEETCPRGGRDGGGGFFRRLFGA